MLVRAQSRLKGRVRSWSALQMQGGASRPRVGWLKVSPNLDGLAVVFLYNTPPPMRCVVQALRSTQRGDCGAVCVAHIMTHAPVPSPDHLYTIYFDSV